MASRLFARGRTTASSNRRTWLYAAGLTTTTTTLGYTLYSSFHSSHAAEDALLPSDPQSLYLHARDARALRMDSSSSSELNSVEVAAGRPSSTWTPPTRAEMLKALGAGSKVSLSSSASDLFGLRHVWDKVLSSASSAWTSPPPESSEPAFEVTSAPGQTGHEDGEFDLLVVGGGATGAGVALDAASRGLSVALVERDDFSSGPFPFAFPFSSLFPFLLTSELRSHAFTRSKPGTSSKSTKLVHGGVRYLQKAVFELDYEQYKLVREALHERKTFLYTAPYLSHPLPIMLPIYKYWQIPYYFAGTKMYDILAGSANMESSYLLGKGKALEAFPMLKADGLVGAVVYYDGQHNDSRMNMALIMTAVQYGAVAANHVEVTELIKDENGMVKGAKMRDVLTGKKWETKAKVCHLCYSLQTVNAEAYPCMLDQQGVINATGPFTDGLRQMDEPSVKPIVSPASGVHITLPNYYAPAKIGLLDPATSDGRVIFFLPWQGNTIAGTTDSPAAVEQHPVPKEEEIEWILNEVRNYLSPDIRVRRGDVLSAWSGLRPLVSDPDAKDTQSLVRNHMINVSPSGLLTIAGGKWTTYRAMAEETVDRAIQEYGLQPMRGCVTTKLRLLGSHGWSKLMFIKLIQQFGLESDVAKHLTDTYGDRAWAVCSMAEPTGLRWPVHGKRLDPVYPYIEAEVTWACRREYAATAVDVIARRTRLSFLNAEAALEALPTVIDIMAKELGWSKSQQNQQFKDAATFLHSMGLKEERLKNLTLDDVRQGKHKERVEIEDEVLARTVFSAQELSQLKSKFNEMDFDKDGKINYKDLSRIMRRLGFANVSKETVSNIIREVDGNRDGKITLEEFLDMAAGVKELSLTNAFTDIVAKVAENPNDDGTKNGLTYEGKNSARSGGGV